MDPWLDIVHRDRDVLLLNKPSGLLSVPGRAAEHADCALSRVLERFCNASNVHRLDMDTSGLLLFGLHRTAHRYLSIGFERRLVKKTYEALVWGHMEKDCGFVDQPLICDWPNRPRQMISAERGKPSQTRWHLLAIEGDYSRVELTPLTGRSHQLRVHMASIGHPLLGDRFYAHEEARAAAARLLLHAGSLAFRHPEDGRYREFSIPCPF